MFVVSNNIIFSLYAINFFMVTFVYDGSGNNNNRHWSDYFPLIPFNNRNGLFYGFVLVCLYIYIFVVLF